MPRMSKKRKAEMAFFIGEHNRMKYNKICLKCENDCKQSFRAQVIQCPSYRKKVSASGAGDSKSE